MNRIKISDSDKRLLLIFCAIVIVACSYFFIFSKGMSKAAKIEEQKQEITGEPKNLEEQAISLVGTDIYEKLIQGYTEKQWGRKCTELPAFIIKRLPVRYTYDNNYFQARYQGIPVGGYNRIIDGLLDGVVGVVLVVREQRELPRRLGSHGGQLALRLAQLAHFQAAQEIPARLDHLLLACLGYAEQAACLRQPLAELQKLRGMTPRAAITKHLLDGDDSFLTGKFDEKQAQEQLPGTVSPPPRRGTRGAVSARAPCRGSSMRAMRTSPRWSPGCKQKRLQSFPKPSPAPACSSWATARRPSFAGRPRNWQP